MRLRYNFDVEKLIQAIAYLSSRGVADLDKLKILKLLFLTDKRHLLEIGRPILGDAYSCMTWGPVPSGSYNIIRNLIDTPQKLEPSVENRLNEYFEIDRRPEHPVLVTKRPPDTDIFSPSELAAFDAVIEEYGKLTGVEIMNLTHTDPIWTIPDRTRKQDSSVPIPFELFFEVNAAQEMLEFARAQQENRDFMLTLEYEAT